MPLSPHHQKQRSKNFALLGALLIFVAVMFGVAMVKFGGSQ